MKKEGIRGLHNDRGMRQNLKNFSPSKSPGDDGFMAEFYCSFFDVVSRDLVNSFNAAYKEGEFLISQHRGVITLMPREDSGLSDLLNWRPLLNLDYKIASKVIAKRIEKILRRIIHPDQTGFVKGRYIGQNIRLINDNHGTY